MQQLVDVASPPITFLLLLAVGLDLTLGDFRRLRDRPGLVGAGVLLPPLLLPPLAVGLIRVFDPAPIIAAGLLLVVVCPIGGLSNSYSLLAHASTALSVTLTAVSCAAAVVTIPAAMAAIDLVWQVPSRYAAPATVLLKQLLVGIAPPVVLGMLVRAWRPTLATRHRGLIMRIAFVLLITLLLLVMASEPGNGEIGWWSAFAVTVAFVVTAFALGTLAARALGGSPADRFTFAAEFSTRNVAVALAIAMALGAQREFTWFGAIYLTVEIPLLVLAALLHRSTHGEKPAC